MHRSFMTLLLAMSLFASVAAEEAVPEPVPEPVPESVPEGMPEPAEERGQELEQGPEQGPEQDLEQDGAPEPALEENQDAAEEAVEAPALDAVQRPNEPAVDSTAAEEEDEPPAEPVVSRTQRQDLIAEHTVPELQLLVGPLTLAQLRVEAEEWLVLVQLAMRSVTRLKVEAISAKGAELSEIQKQIIAASKERNLLMDKFRMILDSMELKGAEPAELARYRKFMSGAMALELQATDLKTTVSQALDWTVSKRGGVGFMIKVGVFFASLALLYFGARIVRSLSQRGLRKVGRVSNLFQEFLLKCVFWLSFIIGLLFILAFLGINVTPLFAVLGGASFILAFAMQETLGNLFAGIMIMVNKPFDVGDLIDSNGILGEVQAVSIVSTTIRTLDNRIVIMPNASVWGGIITNVTFSPVRRVDMVFGISYSDDMGLASQILRDVVDGHPKVLEEPEANIRVHELGDSSVNLICRPWTRTEDYWDVYWDLTRQVKEAFDKAGVSIPFPQRDVHVHQQA